MLSIVNSVKIGISKSLFLSEKLVLFRLNSSLTILGARLYFTLYINIAISCSLRFSSEGNYVRTRRFSYDSEWELNTALSARS